MSEGRVEVVRLGEIHPVENADGLEWTMIHGGYPVVSRRGAFVPGDRAVFVPVDTILPEEGRIKAKRLRGQLSLGLLLPALPGEGEGMEVSGRLGATRWEPTEDRRFGEEDRPGEPAGIPPVPVYDLEGLRRHGSDLVLGEEVVITEKIHGENWRAVWDRPNGEGESSLWVGSRTRWKSRQAASWRSDAVDRSLAVLAEFKGFTLYGEYYGGVGGYPYDCAKGERKIRLFDAYWGAGFLDYDYFVSLADRLGLARVPELYRGPWDPDIAADLAEGDSSLNPAHGREGVVVRPIRERRDCGHRVVLKLIGNRFLLASGRRERAPSRLDSSSPLP